MIDQFPQTPPWSMLVYTEPYGGAIARYRWKAAPLCTAMWTWTS